MTRQSSKVWATALAIAFLEVILPSRAEEWELVASKARTWLTCEAASDTDAAQIIAQASEKLKSLHAEAASKSEFEKKRVLEEQERRGRWLRIAGHLRWRPQKHHR